MPVRIAYACVAVLVGITGGLGNALFIANLPSIQGDLGLTPSQAAWLPAAYFMVNVSANLLMIKFRQQYGLRRFAEIGLTLYALLSIAHVFVEGLEMAIFVRAASGLAAATTSSLGLFYMLQAFRKSDLPKARRAEKANQQHVKKISRGNGGQPTTRPEDILKANQQHVHVIIVKSPDPPKT